MRAHASCSVSFPPVQLGHQLVRLPPPPRAELYLQVLREMRSRRKHAAVVSGTSATPAAPSGEAAAKGGDGEGVDSDGAASAGVEGACALQWRCTAKCLRVPLSWWIRVPTDSMAAVVRAAPLY